MNNTNSTLNLQISNHVNHDVPLYDPAYIVANRHGKYFLREAGAKPVITFPQKEPLSVHNAAAASLYSDDTSNLYLDELPTGPNDAIIVSRFYAKEALKRYTKASSLQERLQLDRLYVVTPLYASEDDNSEKVGCAHLKKVIMLPPHDYIEAWSEFRDKSAPLPSRISIVLALNNPLEQKFNPVQNSALRDLSRLVQMPVLSDGQANPLYATPQELSVINSFFRYSPEMENDLNQW